MELERGRSRVLPLVQWYRRRVGAVKIIRAGGPIRNREMCEKNQESILIAFPGGRGTSSCKMEAARLRIPVLEVVGKP
jgi:hypothetical protein